MHRRFSTTLLLVTVSAVLATAACKRKSEAVEAHVTLRAAPAALSAATVLVDYSQASATPFRSGGEPACAAIAPNMTAQFTDDGQGRITMNASSRDGFSAPIDLAICRMIPDAAGITAETISSRLRVSLLSATDVAGKPVEERRLAHAEGAQGHAPLDDAGGATRPPRRERLEEERREAGVPSPQAPAGAGNERLAAVPPPAAPTEKPRSLVPEQPEDSEDREAQPPADRDNLGDESSDEGVPGREDSNDDSDTDPEAVAYDVTISVTNPVGPLGALQFNILHSGQPGGFAGARGSARCSSMIPTAMATFNDKSGGVLAAGLIQLEPGFPTPGPVVHCTFKSRSSVSSSNFSAELVDATDPSMNPKKPQLAVTDVQRIEQ